METLFQQVAPILEQVGQAGGINPSNLPSVSSTTPPAGTVAPSALTNNSSKGQDHMENNGSNDDMATESSQSIKVEDDMSESFGQLALDEHGHMRWIGGSSTMSLIQSFRTITASPLHRVSPMEEDPLAPGPSVNKLYFPASVFFGKVRALPLPEELEYPERDLADKLVSNGLQLHT